MQIRFPWFLSVAGMLFWALALSGCNSRKSANPLSPDIAGPIPGVAISAPTPMQPAAGARIPVDQQPITLVVINATTSGVRPLSYVFEMAADADFSGEVMTRDGIPPGEGGRTSLTLPGPLPTARTYYWHARAQDGANTGPFSTAMSFAVFTPIVIQAPVLVAPIDNVTTSTLRPTFQFINAARTGPAGSITYTIELATDSAMANIVGAGDVPEQANQTSVTAPQDLSYDTQYFWRVRAFDPTTTGPWSVIQAFRTLPRPAPPPPPPAPPSPGPPDGIDMSQATIVNSPVDLASWARTATITSVTFAPGTFSVDFSKRTGPGRWPDVVPPGFEGPIEYTLGLCLNINGRWYCSAAIQFWYGRDLATTTDIARDWFYDSRWAPMTGYQPRSGELVGIFVGAGSLRNVTGHGGSLTERSNVLLLPWGQSYTSFR